MKLTREEIGCRVEVELNDDILDQVEIYRYLEVTIADNGKVKLVVSNRVNGGSKYLVV